ncbi:MAG: hypothetical protein RRY65_06450 [Pseudoflavonifractor sp.]
MDQELLQAIGQMMDEKLSPIHHRLDGIDSRLDGIDSRLDSMDSRFDGIDSRLDGIDSRLDGIDSRLEALEEGQAEVRSSVNALLEWSEECSDIFKFPLPKVK